MLLVTKRFNTNYDMEHNQINGRSLQHLLCIVDRKTGDKSKTRPRFIKQDQIAIVRLEVIGGRICLESFKEFPQMGRFTLRDEGNVAFMYFMWYFL